MTTHEHVYHWHIGRDLRPRCTTCDSRPPLHQTPWHAWAAYVHCHARWTRPIVRWIVRSCTAYPASRKP